MADVSDKIRKAIEDEGYDWELIEVVESRGKVDPYKEGSYCEVLFRTENGAQFVCGEDRKGASLMKLTEEQANAWMEDHGRTPGW